MAKSKKAWAIYKEIAAVRNLLVWLGVWPTMSATLASVGVFVWARLSHLPGVVQFVLGLTSFTAVIVLAHLAMNLAHWRRVKVDLAPSEGPSSEMVLRVRNLGKPAAFHAQCEIVARRNDPNRLSQRTFDLKWEHTFDRDWQLATGDASNLLVATAEQDRAHELEYLKFWALSGTETKCVESSRWDIGERENLPEYDLQISVFKENAAKPLVSRFTLRTGRTAAMVMTRNS